MTSFGIKVREYTTERDVPTKPIHSIGAAIEKAAELLSYTGNDIAEVFICDDIGTNHISVKRLNSKTITITELL